MVIDGPTVAILATGCTFIGSLGGLLWKFATTTADLKGAVSSLVEAVRDVRSAVQPVPLHEQRIESLESSVARLKESVAGLNEKVAAHDVLHRVKG